MMDITLDKWMPYKRANSLKVNGANSVLNANGIAKNKEGETRLKKASS